MRDQMTHSQDIDQMRQGVARWLLQSYQATGGRYLLRGQDDPIFATDVQAGGVLSLLGVKQMDPQFYQSSGLAAIDPGGLIKAADNTTLTTVYYTKPNGDLAITGYRYGESAPVSAEWTLQISMAKYALGDKQGAARLKFSVDQALAGSPRSGLSLPYALSDGYTFPSGAGGWAASTFPSVASTAWQVLNLLHFNPFVLGGR